MPRPSWKITIDPNGTPVIIQDDEAVSIKCVRPENGISSLVFRINNYYNTVYAKTGITQFDEIELAIKCKNPATYTTVFSGEVYERRMSLNFEGGQMLEAECWGWGIAFDRTLCDASYGTESENPTIDTPEEILDDLIANHIQKRFGGAATQWSIDGTDIDAPHADFSVTNLTSNYHKNLTMVNRLCDLINAHAWADGGDIGVHWYVDTDKHFRMKEIDQDSVDGDWTRYYGGSAASAVFKESHNIIARKQASLYGNLYNSILVASAFRKPAQDIWCEDNGPAWGNYQSTDSYSATQYVVGSHSLRIVPTVNNDPAVTFYPSSHDAGWDFDYCGSQNTIPYLSFYIWCDDVSDAYGVGSSAVVIGKDWDGIVDASGNADYYYMYFNNLLANAQDDKWFHVKIPIGDYYAMAPELADSNAEWLETGTPDWGDIDFVAISLAQLLTTEYVYIDDLHFSGKIVRHCYDASEIALEKERMKLIRLDTALDDTLSTTDNSGTAAMLAEAELYKQSTNVSLLELEFELKEDMLPGQILVVHMGKQVDGTYLWAGFSYRVQKLTHIIDARGFRTIANLTLDVSNSNTQKPADQYRLLMESAGALGHGEAKDLKASGIDPLIPRLAWDPT